MSKLKKIILTSIVILVCSASLYMFLKAYSNKVDRIKELEKTYSTESAKFKKLTTQKDSLARINFFLSKYRGLTEAMTYRDSLRISLKYKVGDRVMLKRDSSRVVITDVIIGGSQYDFYVKYKVVNKDKSTEEIIPELVY